MRKAEPSLPLKEQVIEASLSLLSLRGIAHFSMREVARQANVTHQAPYHYFANKKELLTTLAQLGFTQLATDIRAAMDSVKADAIEQKKICAVTVVKQSGMSYVDFSLKNTELFHLMFHHLEKETSQKRDQIKPQAGDFRTDEAYGELLKLVSFLGWQGSPEVMATLLWAQVHGLACLLTMGDLGRLLPSLELKREYARNSLEEFSRIISHGATHGKPLSNG